MTQGNDWVAVLMTDSCGNMADALTSVAFDAFRSGSSLQPMNTNVGRYVGDTDQMASEDGLECWKDGNAIGLATPGAPPGIAANPDGCRLWVVLEDVVVNAPEKCDFGAVRDATVIKHSNLTGGRPAYVGGELVFSEVDTIVINGCSGRYRVRSEDEFQAVVKAFAQSGYRVWSMGWNSDTDRPAMFGTQDPDWVSSK